MGFLDGASIISGQEVTEEKQETIVRKNTTERMNDESGEVFTLKVASDEHGDGSSDYNVTLNGNVTVKEFVEAVLKRTSEWGNVDIRDRDGLEFKPSYSVEYKDGEVTEGSYGEEIANVKVIKAKAWGGYSNMNYLIRCEC